MESLKPNQYRVSALTHIQRGILIRVDCVVDGEFFGEADWLQTYQNPDSIHSFVDALVERLGWKLADVEKAERPKSPAFLPPDSVWDRYRCAA